MKADVTVKMHFDEWGTPSDRKNVDSVNVERMMVMMIMIARMIMLGWSLTDQKASDYENLA